MQKDLPSDKLTEFDVKTLNKLRSRAWVPMESWLYAARISAREHGGFGCTAEFVDKLVYVF